MKSIFVLFVTLLLMSFLDARGVRQVYVYGQCPGAGCKCNDGDFPLLYCREIIEEPSNIIIEAEADCLTADRSHKRLADCLYYFKLNVRERYTALFYCVYILVLNSMLNYLSSNCM